MKSRNRLLTTMLFALFALTGCEPGPVPIRYGEDGCARCRMQIMDRQFGAELVTTTGKVYTFDSIECLVAFEMESELPEEQRHSRWVTDYQSPGTLLNAEQAVFLQSEQVRSPMGLNLLAGPSSKAVAKLQSRFGGDLLGWKALFPRVRSAWLEGAKTPHSRGH